MKFLRVFFISLAVIFASVSVGAPRAAVLAQSAAAPAPLVLASNAVKAVMEDLRPQCEAAIGRPLILRYDVSTALKKAMDAGEPFDVAILNREGMDAVVGNGEVLADTRRIIAHTGIGVAVRAGAPKPDVSTPEALKRTLLATGSITYPNAGASTPFILKMFNGLGIADQIEPHTLPQATTVRSIALVVDGKADLLITLMSEILPEPGLELDAPVPQKFQGYVTFAAATGAKSRNRDAAAALIRFLGSPAVVPALKAKGMEPAK